jgi:hypothetical protein
MIGMTITMRMMRTMSHDQHVVRLVQHLVHRVLLRDRVAQLRARVRRDLLLRKRKKRKIPVGWLTIEPMMMVPSGLKAKTKHGTIESQDRVIGSSGRIR